MDLLGLNNTQTSYFLVPLLFPKDTKSSQIFNDNYKDAYIADYKKIQHCDKVLLVYNKYSIDIPITTRETQYKIGNDDVLVYTIPEEFMDDYGKFLRGAFSTFSDKAKELILSFWDQDDKSLLYGILYNKVTPKLGSFYKKLGLNPKKDFQKGSEYWNQPQLTREVLGL